MFVCIFTLNDASVSRVHKGLLQIDFLKKKGTIKMSKRLEQILFNKRFRNSQ